MPIIQTQRLPILIKQKSCFSCSWKSIHFLVAMDLLLRPTSAIQRENITEPGVLPRSTLYICILHNLPRVQIARNTFQIRLKIRKLDRTTIYQSEKAGIGQLCELRLNHVPAKRGNSVYIQQEMQMSSYVVVFF